MPEASERFKKAALGGGKLLTRITCTPPGGSATTLSHTSASVTCDMSSASRYTASVTATPEPGTDASEIVGIPGAKFAIDQGFDFGGGDVELVPMGRYELARDPGSSIFGGEIRLDLVDQWARLERARFLAPYTPPAGYRANIIATVVTAAIPGVTVNILANGGQTLGGQTWGTPDSRARTQLISDLSTDGGLDCYFDAAGVFVIREEPAISPTTATWTFKSGSQANIVTAERARPFDRCYNKVLVVPQDETQTWPAQLAWLNDLNHPLHESKYGPAPYFWSSPTLTTASAALAAAKTIMQRVQGTTETLQIGSFGNASLEAGQTVIVVNEATETDPGFAATHLLEAFSFDCLTAEMTASTRSSALAEIEESI